MYIYISTYTHKQLFAKCLNYKIYASTHPFFQLDSWFGTHFYPTSQWIQVENCRFPVAPLSSPTCCLWEAMSAFRSGPACDIYRGVSLAVWKNPWIFQISTGEKCWPASCIYIYTFILVYPMILYLHPTQSICHRKDQGWHLCLDILSHEDGARLTGSTLHLASKPEGFYASHPD